MPVLKNPAIVPFFEKPANVNRRNQEVPEGHPTVLRKLYILSSVRGVLVIMTPSWLHPRFPSIMMDAEQAYINSPEWSAGKSPPARE